MTFEEIEAKLPNGFHDAAIRGIDVDFIGRSVVVALDLLTGTPDDARPELYRPGRLRMTPVYLYFVEPPDAKYPFVPNGSHLKVDGDSVKVGQNADADRLLLALPKNATTYRFFLEKWNAFLYLAGGSVEFSWDDGGSFT